MLVNAVHRSLTAMSHVRSLSPKERYGCLVQAENSGLHDARYGVEITLGYFFTSIEMSKNLLGEREEVELGPFFFSLKVESRSLDGTKGLSI